MKTPLHTTLRRTLTVLALVAVFAAGVVVGHLQFAQAEPEPQALNTVVYEILAGGSPTIARAEPNNSAAELDTLRWGDRVLWDGQSSQTDAAGNRWIRVFLADGTRGWIPANFQDAGTRINASSATYLTAGIEVGGTVTVTNTGNRANLRTEPTVTADLIREVQAGDVLQVVGGPYQTEYLMWWQFQDSEGNTGWIIDVQAWFQPN